MLYSKLSKYAFKIGPCVILLSLQGKFYSFLRHYSSFCLVIYEILEALFCKLACRFSYSLFRNPEHRKIYNFNVLCHERIPRDSELAAGDGRTRMSFLWFYPLYYWSYLGLISSAVWYYVPYPYSLCVHNDDVRRNSDDAFQNEGYTGALSCELTG